jgi:hypothetical protein
VFSLTEQAVKSRHRDAIVGVVKFIIPNVLRGCEIFLNNERMVELDERMVGLGKSSVKMRFFVKHLTQSIKINAN